MSIIQIYDKSRNNEILALVDKLRTVNVDISYYDYTATRDAFEQNNKIDRLIGVYGDMILPITIVDGEIIQVEKHLSVEQIVGQADISMKKIIKAGIEIKASTNNTSCNHNCSKCSCQKNSCSSCDKKACKN